MNLFHVFPDVIICVEHLVTILANQKGLIIIEGLLLLIPVGIRFCSREGGWNKFLNGGFIIFFNFKGLLTGFRSIFGGFGVFLGVLTFGDFLGEFLLR